MTEPKKPTTGKKTPAPNAAKGVICHVGEGCPACSGDVAEIRTFKSGGLPAIAAVADDGNRVGTIADVAFFSGLFPGETPATLAIRILAGQSLGLDAVQALFDIETEAPAIVRYRPAGRTFEQANDAVEAVRAEIVGTPPPIVDDRLTPEPASPPAEGPEKPGNVVEMRPAPADPAEPSQKIDDLANKRPSPIADAETPATKPEPGNGEARAGSAQARAESAATDTPAADAPAPGPKTPDPALTAAGAASIGDVSPETVAAWRQSIANMSRDLNLNADEKTATFDAKPLTEKKKYFDEVFRYYNGKIDTLRKSILDRLRADGKTSTEAQKGFFIYADVSFNPDDWTYFEARKAEAAVTEFLRSKGAKPAA